MPPIDRRRFIVAGAGASLAASAGSLASPPATTPARAPAAAPSRRPGAAGPVAIASGNGVRTVQRAVERMKAGTPTLDAIVEGVGIVEADPSDLTVGYGGLPNEDGVVELDASVMDGPMHRAGAVASLRDVRHPAAVALRVLRDTDHVMLVGEGARRFALAHGFEAEDLLTDEAREAWLKWKRNLNPNDDWLDDDQRLAAGATPGSRGDRADAGPPDVPFTHGTLHCSAIDGSGAMAACTTTSGLSWKIPGRVGDSPIIGAGMYCLNEVGSAGATGRGEAVIQSCGAFQIVRHMDDGLEPTEACLALLKWIVDHTHRVDLLDDRGRPRFNVTTYALRRDGAFGSASIRAGASFAFHDGERSGRARSAALYD